MMFECPLCQSYTLQAYHNIMQSYSLCSQCIDLVHHCPKASQFVYRSLVTQKLSEQVIMRNKVLKKYWKSYKMRHSNKIQLSYILQNFMEQAKSDKEDSTNLTISSDSGFDQQKEQQFQKQPSKVGLIILAQYKSTLKSIEEMQPFRDKIEKTKEMLSQTSSNIKSKFTTFQSHFNSLKAEIPSINIGQSMGVGISFFKKFF